MNCPGSLGRSRQRLPTANYWITGGRVEPGGDAIVREILEETGC
jgi:hypothetical protein